MIIATAGLQRLNDQLSDRKLSFREIEEELSFRTTLW
jgi:hypothetical protein